MPFVRLAALSELQADEGHRVELSDEDAVALIRTGDEVFAVIDNCSHEDYPLSEGWVEDHTIECALHGSRFDLLTGNPDGGAAGARLPGTGRRRRRAGRPAGRLGQAGRRPDPLTRVSLKERRHRDA